jgi:hypothetical protein
MKYLITTTLGTSYELSINAPETLTWKEFTALPEVAALGPIQDITPETMLAALLDGDAIDLDFNLTEVEVDLNTPVSDDSDDEDEDQQEPDN